jgi:hypothetical protein
MRLGFATEELTPSNDSWQGLSGEIAYSLGTIDLSWYTKGGWKLQTTEFHVIRDAPVDMVLGEDLCYEKGVFTLHKNALLFVKNERGVSKGMTTVQFTKCTAVVLTVWNSGERPHQRTARISTQSTEGSTSCCEGVGVEKRSC